MQPASAALPEPAHPFSVQFTWSQWINCWTLTRPLIGTSQWASALDCLKKLKDVSIDLRSSFIKACRVLGQVYRFQLLKKLKQLMSNGVFRSSCWWVARSWRSERRRWALARSMRLRAWSNSATTSTMDSSCSSSTPASLNPWLNSCSWQSRSLRQPPTIRMYWRVFQQS